jgi:hypothetical protein|tara:strand:+ start:2350 stop:2628 length:279 start_codon:yes stop_codon:yes gene_type:complete
MIVEALEKEWNVNDLSFAQRRKIYKKIAKNYANMKKGDPVDVDTYFETIDEVIKVSGLKEADFEGLSMIQIDEVVQAVMFAYTGMSGKDSGG